MLSNNGSHKLLAKMRASRELYRLEGERSFKSIKKSNLTPQPDGFRPADEPETRALMKLIGGGVQSQTVVNLTADQIGETESTLSQFQFHLNYLQIVSPPPLDVLDKSGIVITLSPRLTPTPIGIWR